MESGIEFDFIKNLPEERLATERNHRNDKRVVCRYFVEGKCQKEESCRFLHSLDPDKMPECRHGSRCPLGPPRCPFKHISDAEKEECVNYRLGFCSFGPTCKFRHIKLAPELLPPLSELFLKSYIGDARIQSREEANLSTWRVKECPEFSSELGWCPFFDQCNFAHGEAELRHWRPNKGAAVGEKRPRSEATGRYGAEGGDYGVASQHHYAHPSARPPVDVGSAGAAGSGGSSDLASILQRYDSGAAAALGLPGRDRPAVYFILRTFSGETLQLAFKRNEWITPARDALPVILAASSSGKSVILLFSIFNTAGFEGVAEVIGPAQSLGPQHKVDSTAEGAGDLVALPLRWHRACMLPFAETAGLFTSLPDGTTLPVARSGDWQELGDKAGRALTLLMFESAEVKLDLNGVDSSMPFSVLVRDRPADQAALASEDCGPGVPQIGASAPPPKAWAQVAGGGGSGNYGAAPSPSLPMQPSFYGGGGGGRREPATPPPGAPTALDISDPSLAYLFEKPADDFIAMLLKGKAPPKAPSPPQLAADAFMRGRRAGHMFTSNNVSMPISLTTGVFSAAEDACTGLRDVAEGTPVLLLNVHTYMLHGLFLARGPARKDIVPGLIPRMGAAKKAFPLQVQTLRIVEAAPLPTVAYQPIIGGRPQPGPLEPQRLHALAVEMLTPLPPELLLRIAGMLHQLHALGLPQEGLLTTGAPM